MKFTISREALLRPLTLVAGVVERRQTLPVLSNVLIQVEGDQVAGGQPSGPSRGGNRTG